MFGLSSRRRLKEIARVLWANQLDYVLELSKMRKYLPMKQRFRSLTDEEKRLLPKHILKTFEDLDGSFLKLGQLLSLRPDLIPPEYCDELSKLQDKVRPFSGSDAKVIIEKSLGKPIEKLFKTFNTIPIASASVGQVHLATLKDGSRVAVKVQRPNVKEAMRCDIQILKKIASIIEKKHGTKIIDPSEIVKEFEKYTESELDFLREAKNIDTMNNNACGLRIPKLHWDLTTSCVLTTEYIEGTQFHSMKKWNIQKRKRIADKIVTAFLEQIFIHGFFHADPHPGNFLLTKKGDVVMLDFGITGRVNSEMKDNLGRLYIGLMKGDANVLVESAIKLGVGSVELTDLEQLRRDIQDKLAVYYGVPLEKVKISELLNRIITVFKNNNLKVSPDLVLLAKCTITLESLCSNLDPKYNIVVKSRPFVKRLIKERLNPKNIARKVADQAEELAGFVTELPKNTNIVIRRLRQSEADLANLSNNVAHLTFKVETSSNRIAIGFLIGALLITSSIFLNVDTVSLFGMSAFSFFGFSASLILSIFLFVSIAREGADSI